MLIHGFDSHCTHIRNHLRILFNLCGLFLLNTKLGCIIGQTKQAPFVSIVKHNFLLFFWILYVKDIRYLAFLELPDEFSVYFSHSVVKFWALETTLETHYKYV